MAFDFGEMAPKDDLIVASELLYGAKSLEGKSGFVKTLKSLILERNLLAFWETRCQDLVKLSSGQVDRMKQDIQTQKDSFDKEIEEAKESSGDLDVISLSKKKSDFLLKSCQLKESKEFVESCIELKGPSSGLKIDFLLNLLRTELAYDAVSSDLIERIEVMLEEGGDWERRNKFKVYRGIVHYLNRDFARANEDLTSCLKTFSCTELLSFEQIVVFSSCLSQICLKRVDFKAQIIDSSEVRSFFSKTVGLEGFVTLLYNLDYENFLLSLEQIYLFLKSDVFFAKHLRFYVQELKAKVFSQFLKVFEQVSFEMMCFEFGLSEKFLIKEIEKLIKRHKLLNVKIDLENKIVFNKSFNAQQSSIAMEYNAKILKEGDLLLNKIQTLSRLL